MVNKRLFVSYGNARMCTDFCTAGTAYAFLRQYIWLAVTVHFHFAGAGTASHSDIFDSPSKAGGLMSFKMRQRNQYIRIHKRASDLRFFDIFPIDRNKNFIGAFQPVRYDHLTPCRHRGKSVCIRRIQMIQRVFPAAHI